MGEEVGRMNRVLNAHKTTDKDVKTGKQTFLLLFSNHHGL